MNIFKRFIGHLRTVNKHRAMVRKLCFKCGLYWQGLTHDLSKYSPVEFWIGLVDNLRDMDDWYVTDISLVEFIKYIIERRY